MLGLFSVAPLAFAKEELTAISAIIKAAALADKTKWLDLVEYIGYDIISLLVKLLCGHMQHVRYCGFLNF